ncbi:hypothetical protein HK097_000582 [Rhizophlyctis rosea]|uniref:Uncharacterized protein n=1 Tax=Rhizophlyctis rosea TaxID=64517 RepID=A0AAD5SNK0_9FUNG|nr:hypothetical protein HK097_000582 [Rhizophlyctis rosea]
MQEYFSNEVIIRPLNGSTGLDVGVVWVRLSSVFGTSGVDQSHKDSITPRANPSPCTSTSTSSSSSSSSASAPTASPTETPIIIHSPKTDQKTTTVVALIDVKDDNDTFFKQQVKPNDTDTREDWTSHKGPNAAILADKSLTEGLEGEDGEGKKREPEDNEVGENGSSPGRKRLKGDDVGGGEV